MSRLCAIDELPAQGALAFDAAGKQLLVLLTPAGARGFLNVCPHQGRSLDFAPGEFLFTPSGLLVCPHHGACFDPLNGACTDGPCQGDALTAVRLVERDGALWLDSDS